MQKTVKAGLIFILGVILPWQASVAKPDDAIKTKDVFAVVDGEQISKHDFRMAYEAGVRKRFYHGKIPQQQLDAFKKEVSDTLIERVLLVQEAKRRNIQADPKAVKEQLAKYEQRYASRPDWQQHKNEIITGLTAALEEENVLQQLRHDVRQVPDPSVQALQAFYKQRADLFTTPMQRKVSLILLKVMPASGADVWQAANDEAQNLVTRLRGGANFAESARIHSGDPSASKGGDMGFLHQGMLAPQAEKVLDKLKPGEISDPVMMLRGVAIFRLDEKREPSLNAFNEVKERARQLWQREQATKAWGDLLRNLRTKANITIDMAGL